LIDYLLFIILSFGRGGKERKKIPPWNRDPRVLFHYPMLKYSVAQPPYKKKKRFIFGEGFFEEEVTPALNTLIYSR